METQDNDLGPAEGVKAKPNIMFKISSTSNTHIPCAVYVCWESVCDCVLYSAGYRTMDGLLQRMFETEMDLSADDIEEEEMENRTFSNPAFSSS